ncbi:hypothetical protein HQ529_02540, partial [Candidatus Woesearchaeota archaeon]|nr:hypothetical protein [Candidatus Woesearchaeota archaeon]
MQLRKLTNKARIMQLFMKGEKGVLPPLTLLSGAVSIRTGIDKDVTLDTLTVMKEAGVVEKDSIDCYHSILNKQQAKEYIKENSISLRQQIDGYLKYLTVEREKTAERNA